jgi:ABC-2 type transport system permease protein
MNTQSNAMPESPLHSQGVAPAVPSATRPLYWSVRRELWESRSIYVAPVAVAAVFLFGFLISTIHLAEKMRAAMALYPMQQQELIEQPYDFAALVLMGTAFIVAIFYCLDALHGERRDRSILFWKSLPVSDVTTVLAKASIPLLILPLLTFAITVTLQLIMLLLSSAVLLGSGVSVAALWTQLPLFQMSLLLVYHLVAIHGFWYAPFYAWMLLVSAWARRAVVLWAALPLVAIAVVERVAFNSSHFAAMLGSRFSGGEDDVSAKATNMSMASLTHLAPTQFLTSPGLWIGLAIAAAFLAAAVKLRRYQGPT